MRTRRSVAGVVAVVLAGALAACGGGGGTAETSPATTADPVTIEPTTTTTAPPTTTTTVVSEEEAVLAAYQGYWTTWQAANTPPLPALPGFERYATGEKLESVRIAVDKVRAAGEVFTMPDGALDRHDARIEEIGESTATVIDCWIDDAVVLDARTGAVLDDAVYTWLHKALLVKNDGRWLLEHMDVEAKWDGVAGCAA